jgi:hypothetical protein
MDLIPASYRSSAARRVASNSGLRCPKECTPPALPQSSSRCVRSKFHKYDPRASPITNSMPDDRCNSARNRHDRLM